MLAIFQLEIYMINFLNVKQQSCDLYDSGQVLRFDQKNYLKQSNTMNVQQVPITKPPSRSPMQTYNIAKIIKTEPSQSDRQFSAGHRCERSMLSPSLLDEGSVLVQKLPPNKLVINLNIKVKASGKYPEFCIRDQDTGKVIDIRFQDWRNNWFLYFQSIRNTKSPNNAKLIKAVKNNSYNEVKEILLKDKPDINARDTDGNTVLHLSVMSGNSKLVGLLLYHEAQIDSLNSKLQTPLMIACSLGIEEITQQLITAGADINSQDINKNTCLHLATMNERQKIMDLLLNKQSLNMTLKNKENKIAMDYSSNQQMFLQAMQKQNNNSIKIYDARTDFGSENCNSFNEDKVGPHHFKVHALIGKGSFGEVYLVEKLDTNQLLAMKVLHKSKIQKQNLTRYALTERNVLSLTKHPFIVRLRYAFQTADKLCLIMDYCPGGDLSSHLRREQRFPEERVKLYLTQMILALEDLHKRDIIFRDLKPDNIVLDADGYAMLTDFGLSKEGVQEHYTGARSFCGSVAYLAPEMLKRCGHGKAVDWYLLGVVMYELLVGQPPYYANDREELFNNIQKADLKLPTYISHDGINLLKALLQRNPAKRLGSGKGDAEEIKAHPYFKDIEWGKVKDKEIKMPILSRKTRFIKVEHNVFEIGSFLEQSHLAGWSFAEHKIQQ
ncbi:unnamed protein product (macronuclear) [Paramecium tetraurelia]|uniref:Protein kinase domain-containing protein n=1 Tax=Paramecium tetraurelia TaxID=5888 RepID=A0E888_PARTE|nr:uncharacterized protein GSPATT00024233001 [Paramecium tetraurelia]CAK91505.1 unnamed protein product [Paramecium tetraurelia]|eukprot:XP_001458902.1 hypothetical protein (macronuclear) [Paramecium tetraurelia strain d4-2]